ncbi:hypothetical protein pb186bvf_002287 [Paramecium bursaria]
MISPILIMLVSGKDINTQGLHKNIISLRYLKLATGKQQRLISEFYPYMIKRISFEIDAYTYSMSRILFMNSFLILFQLSNTFKYLIEEITNKSDLQFKCERRGLFLQNNSIPQILVIQISLKIFNIWLSQTLFEQSLMVVQGYDIVLR